MYAGEPRFQHLVRKIYIYACKPQRDLAEKRATMNVIKRDECLQISGSRAGTQPVVHVAEGRDFILCIGHSRLLGLLVEPHP